MKQKKIFERTVALMLCLSLLAGLPVMAVQDLVEPEVSAGQEEIQPLPVTGSGAVVLRDDSTTNIADSEDIDTAFSDVEEIAATDYEVTFENEESRGGWSTVPATGAGTATFADGYMELQADGNTVFADNTAPSLKDGYVEAEITPLNGGGRIALLFRYQGEDSYAGISYDTGWGWCIDSDNGWGTIDNSAPVPQNGVKFLLRVEYTGENIRVLVDGDQIFLGAIPELDLSAGPMGFRIWGYGSGATQCHVKIHNVKMGELDAPVELPADPIRETDENGDYTVTFTDAQRRGGWQAVSGSAVGSVEFVNGEGDAGYLRIAKSDIADNRDKMYAYDASSPSQADGFVQMDVTNDGTQGRFGVLFRYNDSTDYAAVCYDTGTGWKFVNGGNDVDGISFTNAPNLSSSGKTRIRVEYTGEQIKVLVGGTVIFDGTVAGITTRAGQMGAMVWGYGTGQTQGKFKIDNTTMGTPPVEETDEHENRIISFTDATRRGGFQAADGFGQVVFTDGEGAAGYARHEKLEDNDKKSVALATAMPSLADGAVEVTATNHAIGRIGIIFRGVDANNYDALVYDVGTWMIRAKRNGNETDIGIGGLPGWNTGESHRIRIEFAGAQLLISVDNTTFYTGSIDKLVESPISGRFGTTVWGYSTGGNQGKIQIDDVVVSSFVAVHPDVKDKFYLYEEAGKTDLPITLSTDANPLTAVKNGDAILVKDTDYTHDGTALVLKGTYIESLKAAGGATLTLTFQDGYSTTITIRIQAAPREEQISYERDFSANLDGFILKSGSGTLSYDSEKKGASFTGGDNSFLIDDNTPNDLKNCDVEFTYQLANDSGNVAVVARYVDANNWVAVGFGGSGNRTSWSVWNAQGQSVKLLEDGDRFYKNRMEPYTIRVRIVEQNLTIWVDGGEVYSGSSSVLNGGAGKTGLRFTGGSGGLITRFNVTSVELPAVEKTVGSSTPIASDMMTVNMDQSFPRVVDYTLGGKTITGQVRPYYVVELNNKEYRHAVTAEFTQDTATYHMTATIREGVTVTFDTVFTVKDNVLQMKITNIEDTAYPIYSFNFPVQSLVSMSSDRVGAELRQNHYGWSDGAGGAVETTEALATRPADGTYSASSLVVISCDEIAASINCGSINNRRGIAYQTMDNGDTTTTGLWANGYLYRGLDGKVIEEPWTKVAIALDRNVDGKVDFQDAAIARRDDCNKDGETADMQHSDAVMGSLNTIAMDVGSAAQYPFLRILDNVKKLSLGIDNFPQGVVIKGYNGQGHDSNNNDFANYNEGAGGLKDFNTLLENAATYNTKIGIHVNETEVYPESATYGRLHTDVGGWPWYDVARQIIRENDILDTSADGMFGRMDKLNADTNGNISQIYVDVYFASRWNMYSIVNKINSMGMAVSTEYAREMDVHSVWGHHLSDQFNNPGNLARFVNHTNQDVFGGTSLFRSSGDRNSTGINGWQTSYNYQNTLQDFYQNVLPNRFLVQYPIMQWEDNTQAVLGVDKNVVTKMEGNVNVITLDGKEVARGNKIFIPFTVDGIEKIYHWNNEGGSTTWSLPNTFSDQTTVKVFKLSDHGRSDMVTVNVSEGHVTISAQANTGYVIYKGDAEVADTDMETLDWGQGGVKDAGFDSYTPGYGWDISSTAGNTDHVKFENNNRGNTYLKVTGTDDAEITQTITGLTPGKQYIASIWVEVSDGRRATLAVGQGSGEVSNYMDRSNIVYGLHHTDKYKRNIQRLTVRFTAEANTAQFILRAAEGVNDGDYVYFDDARLVQKDQSDQQGHYFFEDFENVDEGYGPFLATESDQSHLSETNLPWTTDTIDGRFSLKTRAGDYFRTAPYTVRLKPDTRYEAGLDYKISGTSGTFTVSVKSDKAAEAGDDTNAVLTSQVCNSTGPWAKGNVTLSFTTGPYDDYYIDITKGTSSEYCIDNFYVDEFLVIDKAALQALYETCENLAQDVYTPDSWAALQSMMTTVDTVLKNDSASEEEITTAYDSLKAAKDALVPYASEEDRVRLQGVIDEMKALSAEDYKQDAQWTAFQEKITEAETLVGQTGDTRPTVAAIEEMIAALRAAKGALNSVLENGTLQALVDFCDAIDRNDVIDGTNIANLFNTALPAAKEALESAKTQEAIDAAHEALETAYLKIQPKRSAAIVTTLTAKLDDAKAVPSPSEALTAAISTAEAVIAGVPVSEGSGATTWQEVLDATAALDAAMPKPDQTEAPAFSLTTQAFPSESANSVFFTLTSTPVTVYKVYTAAEGGEPVDDPTVAIEGTALTLTFTSMPAQAATYHISATAEGKAESARTAVTVETYTKPPVYNPPSNTTTKVEKNEDGSTTKTVTNKKTGTVTETTTWPNGDKSVVETKKDGTVTTNNTSKDGLKTETVTTADGETTSKVTLPKGQDSVKVTVPVKKTTLGTVAVIVREDGTQEIIKTSVSSEGGIRFIAKGNVTVKIIDNVKHFDDVTDDHWAAEAVQFAASRELFVGTGEDTFAPTTEMSRAMLLTVLARLDGVDTAGGDTWYAKATEWARTEGITDGTDLDAPVTREQLAVLLWRYAGEPDAVGEDLSFADGEQVSGWAAEAIDWAIKSGILNGKGANLLDPTGTATRAEVAAILERFTTFLVK